MEVLGSAPGGGQGGARRVNCLPLVAQVDASRHLFDKHWGESLFTKLLVHTEEVDLCHDHVLSFHSHIHRDSSDKGQKLVLVCATDTDVPVLVVARGHQGPSQEVNGVVKSEFSFCVFNVVMGQQVIHGRGLLVVSQVNGAPLKSCR